MPKPFAADIRSWLHGADLAAHLAKHDPQICRWVKGVTIHHTISPTLAQWQGRRSMTSLLGFYRDVRGWSAGPHLFITPSAIWQLTPLNVPGIHGNLCNATHWGIEVVGSYDLFPWPAAVAEQVYGTLAALLKWTGLRADRINGHRDCGSPKTCPGRAIKIEAVRVEVMRRLTRP